MFTRETNAQKISRLTSDDINEMAEAAGLSYDVVEKQLEQIKKQSLYYQSDKVKARNKLYRDRAKELRNAVKSLL